MGTHTAGGASARFVFPHLKGACFSTGRGKLPPIKLLQFRISPHTDFSLLRRPQVERKACWDEAWVGSGDED